MAERKLDIENIGRIGQMFLNGDLLEVIMADRFTCDEDDTDYNIEAFNALKKSLMKTERMNPDMHVTGVIWYWYPANKRMAVPAVAGKTLPMSGWTIAPCDDGLYKCLSDGVNTKINLRDDEITHYFPIRNSADSIVGALALAIGGSRDRLAYRYDIW